MTFANVFGHEFQRSINRSHFPLHFPLTIKCGFEKNLRGNIKNNYLVYCPLLIIKTKIHDLFSEYLLFLIVDLSAFYS